MKMPRLHYLSESQCFRAFVANILNATKTLRLKEFTKFVNSSG